MSRADGSSANGNPVYGSSANGNPVYATPTYGTPGYDVYAV
ncbi:hypothetical protein OIE63_29805 [Streptomyces sp. NBC_01795]|nr:hypothetical protein [Streptomyces sp. NBC_01795]WSA95284.1 hypothetical protein OIE63_29805 [Streptomyces sp. NBC_01795]